MKILKRILLLSISTFLLASLTSPVQAEGELVNPLLTQINSEAGLVISPVPTEVALGAKFSLSGTIDPVKKGVTILRQTKKGDKWSTIGSTKTKADGTEVQEVFNKAFYYENGLAQIRNTDYTKPEVIRSISLKGDKERSLLEKFINKIAGEYGCKHYYKLCEYTDYDPSSNVVSSNSVLVEDDPIF